MAVLHRTQTLSAVMPRFVERFRCIGPSCEDTCCSGWVIHIDKKTYKAYRKEATIPAIDRMMANTVRLGNETNSGRYAAVAPLGESKNCPALQDGLCGVHASLGESFLSNLCHSFPRTHRRVNGQTEQMITLSCPEAARLALLAEDAFDFVEAPSHLRESDLVRVEGRYGIAPDIVDETRIFCLNLMRTRELPVWQRLGMLGAFCDALTLACIRKEQAGIPELIEQFVRMIESGELTTTLEQVQPNHEAQAMVFATLWAAKGFETSSQYQHELMQEIAGKFGADASGQVDAGRLVDAYRRGLERMDEVLASAPWLIEHYLINEMYTQLFPFTGHNPYDSFVHLTARFGLLRLLLAVQCNTDGPLPPAETMTATVFLQCRRFQHDPGYGQKVKESFYESGWAELSKAYSLLRS